jgi:hypothetical protein
MDIQLVKRLEHITLKSELDLLTFGGNFQEVLTLPTMEHDYENETEWLEIDQDEINYNVSKPYEEGTLQEWDDTTPEGCNFGIVLSIYKHHSNVFDNAWIENMVAIVCKKLAVTFNTSVYHYRTFTFGKDVSERKNIIFNP